MEYNNKTLNFLNIVFQKSDKKFLLLLKIIILRYS